MLQMILFYYMTQACMLYRILRQRDAFHGQVSMATCSTDIACSPLEKWCEDQRKGAFRREIHRRARLSSFKDKDGLRIREYIPLCNRTGDPRICAACGHEAVKMRRCSGCRCVYYCSIACSKAAWRKHKHVCDPDHTLPLGTRGIIIENYAENLQ